MVYVDRSGRVLERRPWSMDRIFGLFTGLFGFIVIFFRTLLAPLLDAANNQERRGGSGGGGNGGGWGGGGGGGGRGGRDNGGPNRRIGRIMTIPDCNIPGGG